MSLPGPARRWAAAAVVIPLLAVAAWQWPEGDDGSFVVPQLAAVDTPRSTGAAPAAATTVPGTLELSREVSARLGRVRADCLETQGFPQAGEALAIRRPALGTHARRPLEVALMDFGPTTREEARRFGFGGSELALDEGDRGILISRSTAFDQAATACDRWIYAEVAPGLSVAQTRAAQFQDEVERGYVAEISEALTPVLGERVRCLRDAGYPRLTVSAFLEADNMLAILEAAAVAPGRRDEPAGQAPTPDDVAEGEVGVFEPQVPGAYHPSADEVRFAGAYADCAGPTRFVERVRIASAAARESATRRHAAVAAELGPQLERHLQQLNFAR